MGIGVGISFLNTVRVGGFGRYFGLLSWVCIGAEMTLGPLLILVSSPL